MIYPLRKFFTTKGWLGTIHGHMVKRKKEENTSQDEKLGEGRWCYEPMEQVNPRLTLANQSKARGDHNQCWLLPLGSDWSWSVRSGGSVLLTILISTDQELE
jgi:hypothetical protein